jgi:hypothetical protein
VGPTVLDPPEPVPNPYGIRPNPEIWQVDGAEQPTFESSTGSGVFLTTGYARYTRSTRMLQEPDGKVYLFKSSSAGGVGTLTGTIPTGGRVAYDLGMSLTRPARARARGSPIPES